MPHSPPAKARQGLSIDLGVEVSAVEAGRVALLDFLEPLQLDEMVINRIEVVLEELLSNVVRHAEVATQMTLSAVSQHGELSLCVEDDGEAFNPLEAEENAAFDTLENARLGGLGIPLIKRLTRSVEYDRCGSLNRIRAVMAI